MSDNDPDVTKINIKPGGIQCLMRDGWWDGKPQPINYLFGVPKGVLAAFRERGVNMNGMDIKRMKAVLRSHPDFKCEKF